MNLENIQLASFGRTKNNDANNMNENLDLVLANELRLGLTAQSISNYQVLVLPENLITLLTEKH